LWILLSTTSAAKNGSLRYRKTTGFSRTGRIPLIRREIERLKTGTRRGTTALEALLGFQEMVETAGEWLGSQRGPFDLKQC
jgi:hypothetical protein